MKIILSLILIISILGCNKHEFDVNGSVLILRVDYETFNFEGGQEIMIEKGFNDSDTLPFEVIYKPPTDFGQLIINHQPNGELIFEGTIVWAGSGMLTFPNSFIDVKKFKKKIFKSERPNESELAYIIDRSITFANIEFEKVWESIDKLEVVDSYLEGSKKIGLFVYTPGVAFGNPKEWDYFLLFYK